MGYKTYSRDDLADYTGRPLASFPANYITKSAVPQALLLFKMGTCLASPDDLSDDDRQLIDFAVLSMADAIHLVAPYQKVMSSPFSSESIGSYSYSKAAQAVALGQATGINWFDLAVQKLSVCELLDGLSWSTGIEVFNNDSPVTGGSLHHSSNVTFLSPADMEADWRFRHDPLGTGATAPAFTVSVDTGLELEEDPNRPGIYFVED